LKFDYRRDDVFISYISWFNRTYTNR